MRDFSHTLRLMLSWLLGAIFIYAGILKAFDPIKFADVIHAFRLLPHMAITSLALILPMVEILAGLFLVTGWERRLGIQSILALTIIFAAVILSAMARGLHIDCGCFGSSSIPTHLQLWFALARDAVLFAVALYVHLERAHQET